MANWQPKYDDAQRGAIEQAYQEGVRPVSLICRLAATGELKHEGQAVPSFEIPGTSARYIGDRAKRRREGKLSSELMRLPPKDAVEALRRRMVSLEDHELKRYENRVYKRDAKPQTTKDIDVLTRLARLAREVAAMPGPDETRLPRKPGQRLEDGSPPPEGALRENELTRQILRAGKATSTAYTGTNGSEQS